MMYGAAFPGSRLAYFDEDEDDSKDQRKVSLLPGRQDQANFVVAQPPNFSTWPLRLL